MSVEHVSNSVDIAVSGLRAQSARMKVISNNIANVGTTRGPSGEPYRRQEIVFSTDEDGLTGVSAIAIGKDMRTGFKQVYQPGHPDADDNGYVRMPNVSLPVEMINLLAASRAYQANAAVLKRYQQAVDVALELLK